MICVENLKKRVRQQISCNSIIVKSINNRCKGCCRMAHHLDSAGKPYSDGELVKRCLLDVFKCIDLNKETDYSSIALSHVPMQRRQCNIAQQL